MTSGDVTIDFSDDYVATITIHRPPNNFFDAVLVGAIADGLESLETDYRCRAVVLQSEGKHFCAGAAFGGGDEDVHTPGADNAILYGHAERLFAATLPMVAAVQGAAIGGGLGLALAADFRVGSLETRCSVNFARLGIHPGFALTLTLPLVVGGQRATELLLTGARIDGEEAYRIGLLDRLVPPSEVQAVAHQLAAEIAASAPLAVRSTRATLRGDLAARARAAMAHERAEQNRLFSTSDHAEGVKATAERRPANFQGR
jgi:2-(1,2-epoxy-1,2-dihydrophenyl)acetyl-CoA isomerase